MKHICLGLLLLLFPCAVSAGNVAHLNKFAQPGQDVTDILQKLVDEYSTVIIDEGTWYLSKGIRLRSNIIIKGVSRDHSIIKRKDTGTLCGYMLFFTEYANPNVFTKQNTADAFNTSRLKFKNIQLQSITIDFNRSPNQYNHSQMTASNIYGVALIHSTHCSVSDCYFVDKMTPMCNNGSPAVVFFQSNKSSIDHCESNGVTFVKAIYSDDITISNNSCRSSVGTAIEAMGGRRCNVEQNIVENVYWNVSCIGVNNNNSRIVQNQVTGGAHNISCLTLGHSGYVLSSATGSVVEHNIFKTTGCRSIIIQNGNNISIRNNTCSCIINLESPSLTSGAIVASGENKNIFNISIVNNRLTNSGNGTSGCITYRGVGLLSVKKNTIQSPRGISVLSDEATPVISENEIIGNDYSIQSKSKRKLVIRNNRLGNAVISGSQDIRMTRNVFTQLSQPNYFTSDTPKLLICRNQVIDAAPTVKYAFLKNKKAKGKSSIIIKKNISTNGCNTSEVK